MAELIIPGRHRPEYEPARMRFYCPPCDTTHEFGLKEVERLVYTLTAEAVIALGLREDSAGRFADDIRDPSLCLRQVLISDHPHADQAIRRREQADG